MFHFTLSVSTTTIAPYYPNITEICRNMHIDVNVCVATDFSIIIGHVGKYINWWLLLCYILYSSNQVILLKLEALLKQCYARGEGNAHLTNVDKHLIPTFPGTFLLTGILVCGNTIKGVTSQKGHTVARFERQTIHTHFTVTKPTSCVNRFLLAI